MVFQLPIYYNGSKREISEDIHDNLELTKTIDPSEQPIYQYLFRLVKYYISFNLM